MCEWLHNIENVSIHLLVLLGSFGFCSLLIGGWVWPAVVNVAGCACLFLWCLLMAYLCLWSGGWPCGFWRCLLVGF